MKPSSHNDLLFFMDRSRELPELPHSIQASLIVKSLDQTFLIKNSRTILGRKGGDVVIDDKKVSEQHAVIGYFDGFFFLVDLNSKNHTYLNGEDVVEAILKHGDTIRIGETTMEFHVQGGVVSSANVWPDSQPSVGHILEVMLGTNRKRIDDTTGIMISESPPEILDTPLVGITLHVRCSDMQEREFKFLQSDVLIGRQHGDLPLHDPDISRKHAVVETFGDGQVYIKDLGSTNGTFVNNKKVRRVALDDGDVIRLGSTHLEIRLGEALSVEPPPDPRATALAEAACVRLQVVSGPILGKSFETRAGVWTIGGAEADINIQDPEITAIHAKLHVSDHKIEVEDLGQPVATCVNGKKIKRCVVDSGDVIRLGHTELKIAAALSEDTSLNSAIKSMGYKLDNN